MAAISNPAPGTEYGPCIEPCAHGDCRNIRDEASAPCTICSEPIGYDRPFYVDRYDGPARFKHFDCAIKSRMRPKTPGGKVR